MRLTKLSENLSLLKNMAKDNEFEGSGEQLIDR